MIARYSRPEMRAIWSDEARFNLWLKIETLALEAMVKEGMAPPSALEEVRKKGSFSVERVLELENTVKHDVIAFLSNLAENIGDAARFLHLGMTSSDLLDTAFAVQLGQATRLILVELEQLRAVLKLKAMQFKLTPCIGRSHGIHAEPTTFGLKLAGFYAELSRRRKRILEAKEAISYGAISGAVGTYAHLGTKVEAHVCQALGLKPEPISTQIIPRDRHASYFLALTELGNTIERMCLEIRHLQRSEVREAEEPFSKGQKGSSAMPHKRNPILSENLCGLARLLRGWSWTSMENVALWHERDISHSSVERVIAPDATITLHFMLGRARGLFENLVVYPENMKRNLEHTRGLFHSGALLVALTKKQMIRDDAYRLVQEHALKVWDELARGVSADQVEDFPSRIRSDSRVSSLLDKDEIAELFSMERHFEHVDLIFSRVFAD